MAGGTCFFYRDASDAARMPVQQFGRTQPAREQHCARRHRRSRPVADQRVQQAAGQVLDIGQALAQVRVGDPAYAIVEFAGDALDCGLGREAAAITSATFFSQPASAAIRR